MSLANFLAAQVKRLRQPKYAIGLLFGVGYFWFFFFRRGGGSVRGLFGASGPFGHAPAPFAAGLVTLFLLLQWVIPGDTPGLRFSASEVAFLFPAPWKRRDLVSFKVLSLLFGSVVSGLFFAAVFSRGRLGAPVGPLVVIAWFLVLGIINLHAIASSVVLMRLGEAGVTAALRRRVILGLLAAVVVGTVVVANRHPEWYAGAESPGDVVAAVAATPPLRWLLWPAYRLIHPFLLVTPFRMGRDLAAIAVVLAAHAIWVIRLESPFEDASVIAADKQAARLATMRASGRAALRPETTRRRKDPFALGRSPLPECAFLWKNLIAGDRLWLPPRAWLAVAALLVAAGGVLPRVLGSDFFAVARGVAVISGIVVYLALIYGPLTLRLDLRGDLNQLDLLRSYPLAGWRIALGELLAPAAILTHIVWLAILATWMALGRLPARDPGEWTTPAMRALFALCAAGLTPLVVQIQLLIPNGAAMLFPSFFRMARGTAVGIDQMGHRMLFGFALFAALVFGLAPAAIVFLLLMVASSWLIGPAAALVLASAGAAVVLAGEIVIGIWLVGEGLQRLDPSDAF